MNISGVLPADKIAGRTSAQTVAWIKKLFSGAKTGHAGTLDSAATGVLPVLLGEATSFARFLPETKTYRAEIEFGAATATDDALGEVLMRRPPPHDWESLLQSALPSFVGEISQTAPTYSALKHNGKRMSDYAREGIVAPPKQRRVHVWELQLCEVKDSCAVLHIRCGGGFYVRALARDLGEKLGCGAHLSSLRREQCASFDISRAITAESLADMSIDERVSHVAPVEEALSHLPSHAMPGDSAWIVGSGRDETAGESVRLYHNGRFAGVGLRTADRICGQKMLSWTRL